MTIAISFNNELGSHKNSTEIMGGTYFNGGDQGTHKLKEVA